MEKEEEFKAALELSVLHFQITEAIYQQLNKLASFERSIDSYEEGEWKWKKEGKMAEIMAINEVTAKMINRGKEEEEKLGQISAKEESIIYFYVCSNYTFDLHERRNKEIRKKLEKFKETKTEEEMGN